MSERTMLVITNRDFARDDEHGGYRLLDAPNRKGGRELRLFWASPVAGDGWRLDAVPDKVTTTRFRDLEVAPVRRKSRYVGSDLAAAVLLHRIRSEKRNVLLFIHGYNNRAEGALDRAQDLEERYGVEVIVFTWPANGGGQRVLEDLHGLASYRSDKSDARASTEALDRVIGRMGLLMQEINAGVYPDAEAEARQRYPNDRPSRRAELARLLRERACPFNATLLAHSMGNYLYKKTLMSSDERLSREMAFDNVILKAADTNHAGHAEWVERIQARRRVYILINQEDNALRLSTMKLGDAQRPRLGNTLARQDAPNATYVDVTPAVGDAHSYFHADDLDDGAGDALEQFMDKALQGRVAEKELDYFPDANVYRMR